MSPPRYTLFLGASLVNLSGLSKWLLKSTSSRTFETIFWYLNLKQLRGLQAVVPLFDKSSFLHRRADEMAAAVILRFAIPLQLSYFTSITISSLLHQLDMCKIP